MLPRNRKPNQPIKCKIRRLYSFILDKYAAIKVKQGKNRVDEHILQSNTQNNKKNMHNKSMKLVLSQ
jgi:hypothetical protein